MLKLSTLALLLASVGCGGGESNDPIVLPDSNGGGDDDGSSGACPLPATLTAPAMQAGLKLLDAENNVVQLSVFGPLDASATQLLVFDLWNNFGIFGEGFPTEPTTIEIPGAEADYETCAACVWAMHDSAVLDTIETVPVDAWMATAGTIELTAVSADRVAGTLSNVTLAHATIDMTTQPDGSFTGVTTLNADGCTTSLGSFSFDVVPMEPMQQRIAPRFDQLRRHRAIASAAYRQ